MNTETAFCATCDRPVRFTWTPSPSHEGEANLREPEVVCLEFGECCSGGTCPVSNLPKVVMGVRLARSGLREDAAWRTIRAPCEGCGAVREQKVIDPTYLVCPECGTTNRWAKLESEDAWIVALAPAIHGIPLPGLGNRQ